MPGARILAIESATAQATVAVLAGDALLAHVATPSDRPASEALLPALLEAVAEAGLALDALDAIAVSVGPGSFTGLRVGVATAKGLAFDALPVVAVPTLAALAARAEPGDGPVAAVLDARRGEVYAAIHDGDPLAPPSRGPAVLRPDALADALAACARGRRVRVVGDGVPVVAAHLYERFGDRAALSPPPLGRCDAEAVGRLAQRLLARGAAIAAEALAPVYVRRAEAEVRRTGERFETPSR